MRKDNTCWICKKALEIDKYDGSDYVEVEVEITTKALTDTSKFGYQSIKYNICPKCLDNVVAPVFEK